MERPNLPSVYSARFNSRVGRVLDRNETERALAAVGLTASDIEAVKSDGIGEEVLAGYEEWDGGSSDAFTMAFSDYTGVKYEF
jgi:hypothetical protein